MTNPLFIVVRYGLIDSFDAIEEIEKVIKQKGQAWFGKYGEPIKQNIEARLKDGEENIFVILVRKSTKGESGGYRFKVFRLKEISRMPPKNTSDFPKYYAKTMSRIGCWLLLDLYKGPKLELANLVVRSSLQRLPQTLGSSMRAHFYCRLWS